MNGHIVVLQIEMILDNNIDLDMFHASISKDCFKFFGFEFLKI